ncbi:radical SAM protein [Spirochaeta cellobiosiphila]|uniref:radical SAM protein n=1 Tax=Spirochaeta cellobiosiphila TaxID=504483 RepID=UPI00048E62C8|nr:radical SAM protein [Spirochaeta cellobiosiphila]
MYSFCSNYDSKRSTKSISVEKGKSILDRITKEYSIDSVMTFGGEPLLYPDSTIGILNYAKELGIPSRQIITNAFWTNNKSKIDEICLALEKAEVNNILISIDYFHNEKLNYNIVEYSIARLLTTKLKGIQLHPCWFESSEGDNQFDNKTRELLNYFSQKYNIKISRGNVLFPAGRALENFPNRFKTISNINEIDCKILPYTDKPDKIESICINPYGIIDSLCTDEMEVDDFLENYNPYRDKIMEMFLNEGIEKVLLYAEELSIDFDITEYYSVCDACRDLRQEIKRIKRN